MFAQAIYAEGIKNVTACANPMDLKRGVDQAMGVAIVKRALEEPIRPSRRQLEDALR